MLRPDARSCSASRRLWKPPTTEVIGGLGGFGGLMRLPTGLRKPLLVSGTDGVGTKLELAQEHGSHHGVGIDLVAMCVNDVITSGAAPLFFLDYMATARWRRQRWPRLWRESQMAAGRAVVPCSAAKRQRCQGSPQGRYDLAGFVAVVEEDELIDGQQINPGDSVIGVASARA